MSRPDARAAEQAVADFDRLGRDAFMAQYGFADRNITCEVEVAGQHYPSKAIFGAAFGYMPEGVPRDPDFVSFGECPGFAAMERDYKQAVVTRAQRLLDEMADQGDEALGAALIDLLAGRAGLPCNLIDWLAQKVIDDVRKAQTKQWLARIIEEGLVEKTQKPVRYRLAPKKLI